MATIFAGTEDGLRVIDPGEPGRIELPGQEVTALARDETGWWAVCGATEVWRSTAPGGWDRQGTAPDGLLLRCVAPSPAGVLVGTSEARLLRLNGGGLEPVGAFDHAPDREKWYTPWGGPPDSRSIAVDPEGTVFVNVHVGGIVRSRDRGLTWEPTIDIDSDVHQVIALKDRPGVVLAASAEGLAVSEDSGESWSFHTEGLHGSYCRAAAVAGRTLFVSASEGHRGRKAAVYRTGRDPIGGFEKCQRGLPDWFGSNVDSHCLAAAGARAAFGTEDGEVYGSNDRGKTWSRLADGLPAVRCLALG